MDNQLKKIKEIFFDAVIFLRTDKEVEAGGHPVDRIEVHDFIKVSVNTDVFEPSLTSLPKWNDVIDDVIKSELWKMLKQDSIIFGRTHPLGGLNSEFHAIRSADVRNIVVTSFQERKLEAFKETYQIDI